MKGKAAATILALSSLAIAAGAGMDLPLPREKKPKARMPLTDEETEKLASLSGKEKKAFVKALKEKYAGFREGSTNE